MTDIQALDTLASWCRKAGVAPHLPSGVAFRDGAMACFFGASPERSGYRHIPRLLPHWKRGFEAIGRFLAEGGVLACPYCLQPWPEPVFPASPVGENLTDWLRRTRFPSPWRFNASVHRSGAITRLAGGARAATYRFQEEIWLAAYDAMDRHLAQGGTLRCPCCDRPWSAPEGFSLPPRSEWLPAARMLRAMASEGAKAEVGPPGATRVTLLPVQGQISLNRAAAAILGVDEHPADLLLEWFHGDRELWIRRADGPIHLPLADSTPDTNVVRPITLYRRGSTCGYIVGGLKPFFRAAKGLIWRWRTARSFVPEVLNDALLVYRSGPSHKVGH